MRGGASHGPAAGRSPMHSRTRRFQMLSPLTARRNNGVASPHNKPSSPSADEEQDETARLRHERQPGSDGIKTWWENSCGIVDRRCIENGVLKSCRFKV